MIISCLDYCNSVFAGLPADQVVQLQRIQNNAARLVMKKRKQDHVTPFLKELHWLPVKFRCQYKIATLAYRHFEGSLPPYLSSSLCAYEPSRSLQAKPEIFRGTFFQFHGAACLELTTSRSQKFATLSQFKFNLKTFLFAQAFPQI